MAEILACLPFSMIDQIRALGYSDDDLNQLQGEVDKTLQDILRYDDLLAVVDRDGESAASGETVFSRKGLSESQ